jgi:peroxiredoxin family protein
VKRLAIIVARGERNSLVQVMTLLLAAVGSGIAVRVFFRDEAIFALTADGAKTLRFSEGYRGREAAVRERLAAQGLDDVADLLRQVKALGDARFYACSSSLAICGVAAAELLPEIDGVRGLTAFLLEDVAVADHVLTF